MCIVYDEFDKQHFKIKAYRREKGPKINKCTEFFIRKSGILIDTSTRLPTLNCLITEQGLINAQGGFF